MPSRFEARAVAKVLWEQGERNASAAGRALGVSRRTMQSYFERLRRGASLDDLPRAGRPRILSSTFRRRLAYLKRLDPMASAQVLAARYRARYDELVSVETVRAALHQLGYSWRLPRRRVLTSAQKRERVAFARAHLEHAWDERASADECTFNLYRSGNRSWVRARTSDGEDEPTTPPLTERQLSVSVSIFAVIARGRKIAFAFLPRNWRPNDLVGVVHRNIEPHLRRLGGRARVYELMLDNDGRHFSPVWLEFVERQRLRVLRPWPANSPDLNPIENAFAWLKAYVERMAPTDERTLRQAIEAAWNALPAGHTVHMMDSMPARLRQCLRLHGGRVDYEGFGHS